MAGAKTIDVQSSQGTAPVVAGLVGFVLGQLVGDKAVTVAKGVLQILIALHILDGSDYQRDTIAEAALFVILVIAAFSVALAMKDTWGRELRLAAFWGIFAALFVIVEYSLPVTTNSVNLAVEQPLYFLGWVIGLWLVPLGFLPNRRGATWTERVVRRYEILVVVAVMTVVGLVLGVVVEGVVGLAGENIGERVVGRNDKMCWDCAERFWVARPVGINAICGPVVVVAFANVWWRRLEWPGRVWMWTLRVTAIAAGYAGLWGAWVYDGEAVVGALGRFAGFGALPVIGVAAVVGAYALARKDGDGELGWPVGKEFWWLLPGFFGIACGANAMVGLTEIGGQEGGEKVALVMAHAANGMVLGWMLIVTKTLFRWVQGAGGKAAGEGDVVNGSGGTVGGGHVAG